MPLAGCIWFVITFRGAAVAHSLESCSVSHTHHNIIMPSSHDAYWSTDLRPHVVVHIRPSSSTWWAWMGSTDIHSSQRGASDWAPAARRQTFFSSSLLPLLSSDRGRRRGLERHTSLMSQMGSLLAREGGGVSDMTSKLIELLSFKRYRLKVSKKLHGNMFLTTWLFG